jgi:hypothetical protein
MVILLSVNIFYGVNQPVNIACPHGDQYIGFFAF